jgi:hypothetical protein
MPINVRLLKEVRACILEEPKRLVMGWWCRKGTVGEILRQRDYGRSVIVPSCGTVACIGGWAVLLSGKLDIQWPSFDTVCRVLGLTLEQGMLLLTVSGWGVFGEAFVKAKTPTKRAKIAVQVIDLFLETGGVVSSFVEKTK